MKEVQPLFCHIIVQIQNSFNLQKLIRYIIIQELGRNLKRISADSLVVIQFQIEPSFLNHETPRFHQRKIQNYKMENVLLEIKNYANENHGLGKVNVMDPYKENCFFLMFFHQTLAKNFQNFQYLMWVITMHYLYRRMIIMNSI